MSNSTHYNVDGTAASAAAAAQNKSATGPITAPSLSSSPSTERTRDLLAFLSPSWEVIIPLPSSTVSSPEANAPNAVTASATAPVASPLSSISLMAFRCAKYHLVLREKKSTTTTTASAAAAMGSTVLGQKRPRDDHGRDEGHISELGGGGGFALTPDTEIEVMLVRSGPLMWDARCGSKEVGEALGGTEGGGTAAANPRPAMGLGNMRNVTDDDDDRESILKCLDAIHQQNHSHHQHGGGDGARQQKAMGGSDVIVLPFGETVVVWAASCSLSQLCPKGLGFASFAALFDELIVSNNVANTDHRHHHHARTPRSDGGGGTATADAGRAVAADIKAFATNRNSMTAAMKGDDRATSKTVPLIENMALLSSLLHTFGNGHGMLPGEAAGDGIGSSHPHNPQQVQQQTNQTLFPSSFRGGGGTCSLVDSQLHVPHLGATFLGAGGGGGGHSLSVATTSTSRTPLRNDFNLTTTDPTRTVSDAIAMSSPATVADRLIKAQSVLQHVRRLRCSTEEEEGGGGGGGGGEEVTFYQHHPHNISARVEGGSLRPDSHSHHPSSYPPHHHGAVPSGRPPLSASDSHPFNDGNSFKLIMTPDAEEIAKHMMLRAPSSSSSSSSSPMPLSPPPMVRVDICLQMKEGFGQLNFATFHLRLVNSFEPLTNAMHSIRCQSAAANAVSKAPLPLLPPMPPAASYGGAPPLPPPPSSVHSSFMFSASTAASPFTITHCLTRASQQLLHHQQWSQLVPPLVTSQALLCDALTASTEESLAKEEGLLSSFIVLLNEKKRKIRELLETAHGHEGVIDRLRQHTQQQSAHLGKLEEENAALKRQLQGLLKQQQQRNGGGGGVEHQSENLIFADRQHQRNFDENVFATPSLPPQQQSQQPPVAASPVSATPVPIPPPPPPAPTSPSRHQRVDVSHSSAKRQTDVGDVGRTLAMGGGGGGGALGLGMGGLQALAGWGDVSSSKGASHACATAFDAFEDDTDDSNGPLQ